VARRLAGSVNVIAYEDLTPNRVIELGSATVDRDEMIDFARRFDPQPFHLDEEAAASSIFGGLAASGWYTVGLWMRRYVDTVLGDSTGMGSPGGRDLTWHAPVFAGDVLDCRLEVLTARRSASRPEMGIVDIRGTAHRGERCVFSATFTALYGVRSGPSLEHVQAGELGSVTDDLLQNNARYAESFSGPLPSPPSRHVAVVACMDARLDIYRILGLQEGEAHVIRNAGGVITDDAIRSLAISQRLLGTSEIILIHHTDCGMLTFTDDEFSKSIQDEVGVKPPWRAESFPDLDEDVRQSIARIKNSPFVPEKGAIRGFVFDVASGKLNEVI